MKAQAKLLMLDLGLALMGVLAITGIAVVAIYLSPAGLFTLMGTVGVGSLLLLERRDLKDEIKDGCRMNQTPTR